MAKDKKIDMIVVQEILDNEILDNNLFSTKSPYVIFVTGVSGSGKSTFIKNIHNFNTLKIQPDNYRKLHPNLDYYIQTLGRDNAHKKTGSYSFNFAKKLIEKGIEKNLNIVYEATFSKLETAKDLIQPFLDNSYNIFIVTLPVDLNLSIERNKNRYENKKNQDHTIPRIVSIEDLKNMANSYEETIQKIKKDYKNIKFIHNPLPENLLKSINT